MVQRRWSAGERSKSDCSASYLPGGEPLALTVRSSVGSLFGKAIAETALRVCAELGAATGVLEIDDDGALNFVVAARAEAALRMAGFARVGGRAAALARAASAPDRPRRSRLYLPGNQPHLAINAGLFGADCLILDLEDSVVPDRKFEARILVRRTLEESPMFGDCEIIVRINPLSGPYGGDDIAEILPARPHAILLPKCESAADVAAADKAISEAEKGGRDPPRNDRPYTPYRNRARRPRGEGHRDRLVAQRGPLLRQGGFFEGYRGRPRSDQTRPAPGSKVCSPGR